jgi:hypothetical protein
MVEQHGLLARRGESCFLQQLFDCPRTVRECYPAPELEIDCPSELLDGGPAQGPSMRPAGREQWYRVKPRLAAHDVGCYFSEPRYCAPVSAPPECTANTDLVLECERPVSDGGSPGTGEPRLRTGTVPQPPKGHEGDFFLRSFVYETAPGRCERIPDTWCNPYFPCEIPTGIPAPCSERRAPR